MSFDVQEISTPSSFKLLLTIAIAFHGKDLKVTRGASEHRDLRARGYGVDDKLEPDPESGDGSESRRLMSNCSDSSEASFL
jgi:hypothetical protein